MEERIGEWLIGVFLVASFCWVGYVSAATPAEAGPPVPAVAKETVYEVVPPYGVSTAKVEQPVKRLDTLEGKTIAGVYGALFHFEETWPVIVELLKKRYPTAKFVGWQEFGRDSSVLENSVKFGVLLKQYKVDAVVVGNGC